MKSKPNLDIIDEAIHLIESKSERYTCTALSRACQKFGGHYFGSDDSSKSGETYRAQYRLVMTGAKGKLPSWWNSNGRHKTARTAALKKFKAACIAAGKAQQ
jgi:hypothetical protein